MIQCTDGAVEVTPTGILSHKTSETAVHPTDVSAVVKSTTQSVETSGSDTSFSSREQTDASSIDSLDASPVEKRGSKSSVRRSRKNPIVAIYHKRKSLIPSGTHADDRVALDKSPEASRRSSVPHKHRPLDRLCVPVQAESPPSKSPVLQKDADGTAASFDKSPEASRRSSAPHDRPVAVKLHIPDQAECLPPQPPIRKKRLLQASKSDGCSSTSPREDGDSQLLGGGLDQVDSGTCEAPQTAPVLRHKTSSGKLMFRMNQKIRSCLAFTSKAPDQPRTSNSGEDVKVRVVDLSSENVPVTPSVLMLTYAELLQLGRSSRQVACATKPSSAYGCFLYNWLSVFARAWA